MLMMTILLFQQIANPGPCFETIEEVSIRKIDISWAMTLLICLNGLAALQVSQKMLSKIMEAVIRRIFVHKNEELTEEKVSSIQHFQSPSIEIH